MTRYLAPALIILLFIPLPLKGFLRLDFSLPNFEIERYLKVQEFASALPDIQLENGKTIRLSSLPLDFQSSLHKHSYTQNPNIAQLIKDSLQSKQVRLVVPQDLKLWSLHPSNNNHQLPAQQAAKLLRSYFLQPQQVIALEPEANPQSKQPEYTEHQNLSFYYQGKSREIPFQLLKPYFFQNLEGRQTLNYQGLQKLHQILRLPFAIQDKVSISLEPLTIQHSFPHQIIDHAQLSRDLTAQKTDIQLSFLRPYTFVQSTDPRFSYQASSIKTSFYGSSASRKHNIQTGAQTLKAFILPSQGEFSFNQAVGKVSAQSGYQKGLVITSRGIVSEYGGGLCQVATSFYRAALINGMHIQERHPHSHAVSYYAQELGHGLDAAIYEGFKDLRFQNRSTQDLIFEAIYHDNELQINTYGQTPKIYDFRNYQSFNRHSAPPTKYIYDTQNTAPEVVQEAINGFETTWELHIPGASQKIYSQYQAKPKIIKTAAIP